MALSAIDGLCQSNAYARNFILPAVVDSIIKVGRNFEKKMLTSTTKYFVTIYIPYKIF